MSQPHPTNPEPELYFNPEYLDKRASDDIAGLTTLQLVVLIHCCIDVSSFTLRCSSETLQTALKRLIERGLIEGSPNTGSGYIATDRGQAHLKQLTNLPLPHPAWLDNEGNLL